MRQQKSTSISNSTQTCNWTSLLLRINCKTRCVQKLKVVSMTFQDLFRAFSRTFQDHVFPGLFNRVDTEQVRFSQHWIRNTVHNYTKQHIELSMTVDNDNVCKGRKHVRNAATIWFIFHDSPGPRPNSTTFQDWKVWILISMTFQDL